MKLSEVNTTKVNDTGSALEVLECIQDDIQKLYKFMKKDYRFKDEANKIVKHLSGIQQIIRVMEQASTDDHDDWKERGGQYR